MGAGRRARGIARCGAHPHDGGVELDGCRQHISSFLLRQGIAYTGKPWTKKHRLWLGGLEFEQAAHRLLLVELLAALDH